MDTDSTHQHSVKTVQTHSVIYVVMITLFVRAVNKVTELIQAFVHRVQTITVYFVLKIIYTVQNAGQVTEQTQVSNALLAKTQIVKNVELTIKTVTLVTQVMLKTTLVSV